MNKRREPTQEEQIVRALAMEEAARFLEIKAHGWAQEWLTEGAAVLRGLAPLPPALVAVPRETLAKVREALEHCRQRPHEHNPSPEWQGPTRCDVIDRALDALEGK